MKFRHLFLAFFIFSSAFAQTKGTITGTLTDREAKNAALPFANAMIKGTTIGTTTDENGKYSIKVEPGNYTIVFSFLGYENAEAAVSVKAGETVIINKVLGSGNYKVEDVVVKGTVGREKETALLVEQKNAIEMKQAIGAQEIARKGINDAAGAVLKTAGVSKTEGVNNVFVRGLGDRYNSTTLNGLPLPSEDPVYKNISLEFFGSNIIKNINVNKTFSAGLYADVAGANIDISSKELDKNSLLSVSVGEGYNTRAMNAGSKFLVADQAYNYFGTLSNGRYAPITDLHQYNFKSKFNTDTKQNPINSSFNIIGGGKFKLGGDRSLSLFGVANSSSNYYYYEGANAESTAAGFFTRQMNMQRSKYEAAQTYLGNAKYKFGSGSVSLNSLYIHDNSQYVANYIGFDNGINDNQELPGSQKSIITRQQANDNILFSNQALADYKFTDKISANAGVSYNTIRGTEPDRKTNEYYYDDINARYVLSKNSSADNNRFFSTLNENDLAGKAEVNYTFNPAAEKPAILTVGGNYRKTDRDFNFLQFNFVFNQPPAVDPSNPDVFFNQQNLDLGIANGTPGFNLATDRGGITNTKALDPFYYNARREIDGGYAKMVYNFSDKFTAQVGVRFEAIKQTIEWDTNISSSVNDLSVKPSIIDKKYLLPSVNLKYTLNEKNALRFAASETYTIPQFKEVAAFLYTDINSSEYGNPYLVPSDDYNLDAKYDFSPSKKEIISIGAFYKYIQNPISRIQVASAANDYSYVNTDKAFVTGAELEVKKILYSLESDTRNNDFSFGLNASYLYTEQVQNDSPNDYLTVQFTHPKGKMQGASPLIINSDLSYNTSNAYTSFLSTVVFNYFYDKVYSVGTTQRENTVEKAVPTLDLINKFELKKYKLAINFGIINILDPKYKLTMDTKDPNTSAVSETLINSYHKGIVYSLGLTWTL